MGPDDFSRRNYNTGKPRPDQSTQRPISAAHNKQHPPQGPIEEFGAPQKVQRPAPGFKLQHPIPQRPMRPHHPTQQQTPSQHQVDFSEGAKEHKQSKKKRRIPKTNKITMIVGVIATCLVLGVLATVALNSDDNKKPVNRQPAIAPLVKPDFTVYYPTPMPPGLSTTKSSIAYSKDSFTFIIKQGGENRFFISEQPASTDPDLSVLKSKLAAPKDLKLTLGPGITGVLDSGTITAVKTDKNTIITINCVKTAACFDISNQIFSAMQINDDLDALRRNN